MKNKPKNRILASLCVLLVVFNAGFFEGYLRLAADAADTDELEDSISSLEKKLEKEQKEKARLESALNNIQGGISAAQSEINKRQSLINKAADELERHEAELEAAQKKLSLEKALLSSILQEVYLTKQEPAVYVLASEQSFGDIWSKNDNQLALGEKLVKITQEISLTKEEIEQNKQQVAEAKQQHEEVLDEKQDQKQELLEDKAVVALDVAEKQKAIDKLNRELSEMQSDLNKLLGKSYNAKDIKDAVEFASKRTGVPKGFLYGMLKMETNLGANVGGCTYGEVEKGAEANYKKGKLSKRAWATFQNRRETFKDICDDLDYDYKKQKVSCNPSGYAGTGGAMGVAQFMPDTWNGYKAQVSSVTGHSPADPWNLTDGVTAMALKLKKTPGVTSGSKSALKSAACSYLGTCYAPYINGILYWADHYKELI
ncbi:MAG TPA: lytic murein transglycosylase [Candidatus Moranbacteria bacterium]|nr:lytic murein transglycosylase [Candidatus Moranbacteria bacterium]